MLEDSDIAQALKAAGLEIYRAVGDEVQLAERVRENLIMDAYVRVRSRTVSFVARAQQRDFPEESSEALFNRARRLGASAVARGYNEAANYVTELPDPNDPDRTLDSWYEVEFAKPVEDIDRAIAEVRFALAQVRRASR